MNGEIFMPEKSGHPNSMQREEALQRLLDQAMRNPGAASMMEVYSHYSVCQQVYQTITNHSDPQLIASLAAHSR